MVGGSIMLAFLFVEVGQRLMSRLEIGRPGQGALQPTQSQALLADFEQSRANLRGGAVIVMKLSGLFRQQITDACQLVTCLLVFR